MKYIRPALLPVLLLTTMPSTAAFGQDVSESPGDTVVLHGRLSALSHDSVDVTLSRKGVYILVLRPAGAIATLRPLSRYGRAAFTSPIANRSDAWQTTLETHPYETGLHHLAVTAPQGVDTVEFWIETDLRSAARAKTAREREWGFGITLGMAYHDGYHIRSDDTVPRSGSVAYEGGLILGTSGRFSGVLGVGADPRDGHSRPVTWVFGEPRIRIYEWPRERRVVDLEVAGRIGQGNSGPRSVDPSELAAGLVVACHLDHAPGSRGLRAVLEILHGRFGNVGDFTGNQFTSLSVNLSWLP